MMRVTLTESQRVLLVRLLDRHLESALEADEWLDTLHLSGVLVADAPSQGVVGVRFTRGPDFTSGRCPLCGDTHTYDQCGVW